MITKEQKRLWVEALNSGKYKQGHGRLRTRNKQGEFTYCCLGVLADVCYPDFNPEGFGFLMNGSLSESLEGRLVARNDTGIDAVSGIFINKKQSFKRIAKWIENNVPTSD